VVRECAGMSLEASRVGLGRVAAWRTGVDGGTKLLHQPEVVALIPDLRHLALVTEAKDVDPEGSLRGKRTATRAEPMALAQPRSPSREN